MRFVLLLLLSFQGSVWAQAQEQAAASGPPASQGEPAPSGGVTILSLGGSSTSTPSCTLVGEGPNASGNPAGALSSKAAGLDLSALNPLGASAPAENPPSSATGAASKGSGDLGGFFKGLQRAVGHAAEKALVEIAARNANQSASDAESQSNQARSEIVNGGYAGLASLPERYQPAAVERAVSEAALASDRNLSTTHPVKLAAENTFRNLKDANGLARAEPASFSSLMASSQPLDAALSANLLAHGLPPARARGLSSPWVTASQQALQGQRIPLLLPTGVASLENLACDSLAGAILPSDLRKTSLTSLDYLLIYRRLLTGEFPETIRLRPKRRKQLESLAFDFSPVKVIEGYQPQAGDLLVYRKLDQAFGRVMLVRDYDAKAGTARAYEWDPAFRRVQERVVSVRETAVQELPRRFVEGYFGLRLKKDPKNICEDIKRSIASSGPVSVKGR